ncbi:MAG: hypothetical protein F6K19_34905 [Cyanothece sp. SIO1E1]|nr:hypothetical protein [Cyanothece sp. SIO1E1]
MAAKEPNSLIDARVQIQCEDRWRVYHRLQELDIPCWYAAHQPLQVQVRGAIAAIQIQSVIRQVTMPRWELAQVLERCWSL